MLGYRFLYKGGITKPDNYQTEKMFVFVVIGGQEVPLYQLVRDGLVTEVSNQEYESSYDLFKIFLSSQDASFGSANRRFYSFYVRLKLVTDDESPTVTIRPFGWDRVDFYFKAKCLFLKKSQILEELSDSSQSKEFVKRQGPLPVKLLKELISVEEPDIKKGVRRIRIGGGG